MKKILVLLIVIGVALVGVVAMQPSEFRVTRTATINAPSGMIFSQINNLRQWPTWDPWSRMDPNSQTTYEGPGEGVGAVSRWVSANKEVGEGSLTITESTPESSIKMKLEMLKPVVANNTVEFSFKPADQGTEVTWSMYGEKDFVGKAMGLIYNCEKMVGGQFDAGLAELKSALEGSAATAPAPAPDAMMAPAPDDAMMAAPETGAAAPAPEDAMMAAPATDASAPAPEDAMMAVPEAAPAADAAAPAPADATMAAPEAAPAADAAAPAADAVEPAMEEKTTPQE